MGGRPRTDIGTYGEINVITVRANVYEARARFRLRNGRSKPVSRRAESKAAAKRRLKAALAEMADEVTGGDITADTRMSRVMDLWLVGFEEKVTLGKRASSSFYDYRDSIKNYLKPLIGDLACREAENAGLLNEVLKDIRRTAAKNEARAKNGEAAMLRARTVLSNVCAHAVLHGAMKVNPVKSTEKIDREQEEVRVLEPEERVDFLEKFHAEITRMVTSQAKPTKGTYRLGLRAQSWTDLPELVESLLSTGLRLGEALAVVPESVDLDTRQVHASHHLVRIEGVGMVRKEKRKGDRPGLKVPVLSWTEAMWRRRKLAAVPGGPVFPAWNGGWLDPSNVAKRLNKVCVAIGYEWVSSRYFRHTAGSHLADSGLSVHEGADALGNTVDVFEKHYRRKRVANPKVAAAMEKLLDQ